MRNTEQPSCVAGFCLTLHRILRVNSSIAHELAHESVQRVSQTFLSHPRLLVIGESKRSGLILCKPHYAEFAGPGAAIACPGENGYVSVLALGSPDIVEVFTPEERQKAYSRRIQWVRWLNKIVTQPDCIQRVEKLVAGFNEFFGEQILADIPNEILALLAGVLPQTVDQVRPQPPCTPIAIAQSKPVNTIKLLDWRILQPAMTQPVITVRSNFSETRTALPHSA
jgi:hypothetical protein